VLKGFKGKRAHHEKKSPIFANVGFQVLTAEKYEYQSSGM
jgi:hypothetical protein